MALSSLLEGRVLTSLSSNWDPHWTEKIRRIEAGHRDEGQSRQPGDGMLVSQGVLGMKRVVWGVEMEL